MLTARLAQTDAFQQQKETERLEHQIKEDEAAAEEWKGKREKALQRAKEVQEQIKSFNKEAQLKKTEVRQSSSDLIPSVLILILFSLPLRKTLRLPART